MDTHCPTSPASHRHRIKATKAPRTGLRPALVHTETSPKSVLGHGLPGPQQTWPQTWPLSDHVDKRQGLRTVRSLSPLGTPTAIGCRCRSAKATDRKQICHIEFGSDSGPSSSCQRTVAAITVHSPFQPPHPPFKSLPHLWVQRTWGPSTPHHTPNMAATTATSRRSPAPGAKAPERWVTSEGHTRSPSRAHSQLKGSWKVPCPCRAAC